MSLNARQERILEMLRAQSRVEVEELARLFSVTTQTVRRDLGELCDAGLATRTHGGARRLISTATIGYDERRLRNNTAKEEIGRSAAALIPDGSSVMLNIGTTTEQVASSLGTHKDLVVISNNINVVHILRSARLRSLVIAGGTVRQSDGAIVGSDAVSFISQYKADYAIIGASSLDADGSILDFDEREVAVARCILRNSRTRILVADMSKFDSTAPVRICDVGDLDYVVMDREPPEAFRQAASAGQTRILTARGGARETDGATSQMGKTRMPL